MVRLEAPAALLLVVRWYPENAPDTYTPYEPDVPRLVDAVLTRPQAKLVPSVDTLTASQAGSQSLGLLLEHEYDVLFSLRCALLTAQLAGSGNI